MLHVDKHHQAETLGCMGTVMICHTRGEYNNLFCFLKCQLPYHCLYTILLLKNSYN